MMKLSICAEYMLSLVLTWDIDKGSHDIVENQDEL